MRRYFESYNDSNRKNSERIDSKHTPHVKPSDHVFAIRSMERHHEDETSMNEENQDAELGKLSDTEGNR